MTPVDFKILFLRRGLTQKQIAKEIGCISSAVSQTINFLRPNKRIRKSMAEYLKIPYNELWLDETKARKKAPKR